MNEALTSRPVTVVLPLEQRAWLVRQAAQRAAETGGRLSVSSIVRDLVEQAQAKAAEAAA